ncbi:thymidylate synthase [Haloarcula virus HVTV-2]|uniref:Thymidylate synthetase n=1 Tax=Haloarcula vallismortis tailed virus 1 TaxID=1262528 RepID=L7TJ41_9CAUD|nr:thymidylate synthase [Haloarcula vallismortis tailed virus 1]AGC34408.1 thymidylate synthetase [Haloarcula vallismortis tailed virus 1]UBF22845.1 thymidylate synthase [Haloarcula virus HVTV-2]
MAFTACLRCISVRLVLCEEVTNIYRPRTPASLSPYLYHLETRTETCMRVEVERSTDQPEFHVARAAKNDYMESWVADKTNDELIASIREDEGNWEQQLEAFLKRLMKKGHFGPFEHPQITFAIEGVSRSLMAQLTRHRTGITFDIQSQRYVDFTDTDAEELVVEPKSCTDREHVGRNPDTPTPEEVQERTGVPVGQQFEEAQATFVKAINDSVQAYRNLVALGWPPEDARFVLPIGSKVNIYMTLNARTLMHIADMRAQADAQWEIRELTGEVLDLAEEWMPLTFGFYREEMIHRKNRLAP